MGSESSMTELLATVSAKKTPEFVPPNPVPASDKTPAKEKKNKNENQTESSKESANDKHEKSTKKKEKKKKKEKQEEEPMETNEDQSHDLQEKTKPASILKQKETLEDPGWDFNLTGVTLPSWNKTSIWDESDEEEMDVEDNGTKKHVGKKE